MHFNLHWVIDILHLKLLEPKMNLKEYIDAVLLYFWEFCFLNGGSGKRKSDFNANRLPNQCNILLYNAFLAKYLPPLHNHALGEYPKYCFWCNASF